MTASPTPVREGDVVAGKYRIERVLGRGGMGVVFAATHMQLGEQVALKFLGATLAASPESTQRFLIEARATFRLRSENAVRMLDLGALPGGEGFIVMELLDGQDLRRLLATRGPASASDAARWVIDACGALKEAHALGIVHRDLKPSNLFLAKRSHGAPIVKVLDFGVSKVEGRDPNGPISSKHTPIGTPKYMAPEQWKPPFTVDARTDIYTLGIVLYELLTGRVPLHELSLDERRVRLLGGAVPSPKMLRPGLGEAICKVTLRCMQPVPEGRYPSVEHLASALHDAVPNAAPRPPKAQLGDTAVTAVVREDVIKRDAALAFADVTEKQAAAPLFEQRGEVTQTEFLQVRGTPAASPANAPPSTQRGSPGAGSGRTVQSFERPPLTPVRDRMLTPTNVDVLNAPAIRPVAPPEPIRPPMLTPTQNDPRTKTLQSALKPSWLPPVAVAPSAQVRTTPIPIMPAPAPSKSISPAPVAPAPIAPVASAQNAPVASAPFASVASVASAAPVAHHPVAFAQPRIPSSSVPPPIAWAPTPSPTSRVLIAVLVSLAVAASIGVVAMLLLLRR